MFCPLGKVKVKAQPLTGVLLVLVIVMAAVNPVFQVFMV